MEYSEKEKAFDAGIELQISRGELKRKIEASKLSLSHITTNIDLLSKEEVSALESILEKLEETVRSLDAKHS